MIVQIIGKGGMARELDAYLGVPTVTYEQEEIKHAHADRPTYIAIGDGSVRKKIYEQHPRFYYPSFSAGKHYKDNFIGMGTIICPGAQILASAVIGRFCIINVNANVHHDCVLGNFVTISPGAVICGNVEIGDETFIGANATVIEKVKICSNVIIGAGSVVIKDITEPGIYVGNPARKIK